MKNLFAVALLLAACARVPIARPAVRLVSRKHER